MQLNLPRTHKGISGSFSYLKKIRANITWWVKKTMALQEYYRSFLRNVQSMWRAIGPIYF